jgi:tetratricopeptide (TPR) repeat protein
VIILNVALATAAPPLIGSPRHFGRTMRLRRPLTARPTCRLLAAVMVLASVCGQGVAAPTDTALSSEERAKLDTFEGVSIDKADKVFAAKDWPRAVAEYDAFIVQFPESRATPYAILRKGRALQQANKRFEAIKVYQEALDFFPDDVKYAAAALYRIGESHLQNGDAPKAMKAWLELANDAEYVREPLGAAALNGLAENLIKQGKADEGITRYEQVATEFRKTNPDAARDAIARVVAHHVRVKPDAGKLRGFYSAAQTFQRDANTPAVELDTDPAFWRSVRKLIDEHGTFTAAQAAEQDTFYRYWAGQLQGKLPSDDEQQIAIATYTRFFERDDAAWADRLDKQFAGRQQEGDFARVTRWIGVFCKGGNKAKAEEYYRKLDFAKMSNADVLGLVYALVENGGEAGLAVNTFDKLKLAEMKDDEKQAICDWMRDRPKLPGTRELALRACRGFNDPLQGRRAALRYCHWRCRPHAGGSPADFTEGLALAGELQKEPPTAKEAFLLGGNLLHWSGKYEDAIKAYQQADSPPQTLFWTAECLAKLGKLEPAIAQLREVENFFKDRAAEAALAAAYAYRDAGIKEKYVRTLRGVLKKYPKSAESSQAHQRLEEMGLPIGGGVDADE